MIASCGMNTVRHPRGSYSVIPIAVSGVATPENKIITGAVIHKEESRHKVPKSVLRAELGRMQCTLHAIRRPPHALGASNVCLVGENPTCSVPAL